MNRRSLFKTFASAFLIAISSLAANAQDGRFAVGAGLLANLSCLVGQVIYAPPPPISGSYSGGVWSYMWDFPGFYGNIYTGTVYDVQGITFYVQRNEPEPGSSVLTGLLVAMAGTYGNGTSATSLVNFMGSMAGQFSFAGSDPGEPHEVSIQKAIDFDETGSCELYLSVGLSLHVLPLPPPPPIGKITE